MSDPAQRTVLDLADRTFRHAGARIVATLAAQLGADHLDLVEDAVQDALVAAINTWTDGDLPLDPAAWLYRAAKNRALDILRRDARSQPLSEMTGSSASEVSETEMMDSQLRMLFMCCHPSLSPAARVALSLNIVGGLSAPETGRALLMSESAIRQVIVRAKRKLRDSAVSLALPAQHDLQDRLDSVLDALYLMFNEGYSAYEGERVVRTELCHEAIRMCGLLGDNLTTDLPPVHALTALMLFQSARLDARSGDGGEAITLRHQDRSRWDRRMIVAAFSELELSARGSSVSRYHLEAEIASYHAGSESYEATDWSAIISAYDALLDMAPSPVVALGRAVAVGERDGPLAGLRELKTLDDDAALADYPFFHAARAELLKRSDNIGESREAYSKALALTLSNPVRLSLAKQLES